MDTLNGVVITIPFKRSWPVVVFLCFWLSGWAFGGLMTMVQLLFGKVDGSARLFLALWLVGWAFGLWAASRSLYQMLRGKEVFSVTRELLSITTPGLLRSRSKSYAMETVRKLRTQAPNLLRTGQFGTRYNRYFPDGTILFDHGMQSVTFTRGIDEPEAKYLLSVLNNKGLTTQANYD